MRLGTRLVVGLIRRLPRPDPPTPAYLRLIRRELPPPLARLVLGRVAPEVTVADREVPVEGRSVQVRVYRPAGAEEPAPLVVNFHGGGFVLGNLTASDWLCGNVAARTGAVVVSVDYRLAPEHPAPAAFDDAWAVTRWLVERPEELGVDPDRVSLLGESAGGNLAALAALAWRDRARSDPTWPRLRHQVLVYPATDLTLTSGSAVELGEAPMLGRRQLDWYGRAYLPQGRPDSIASDDPRVSPLHAPDHTDLAPALVIAAGHDPLHDDAVRYAAALRAAGVEVRLVVYPDAIHGFVSIPRFERHAAEALPEIVSALR